jgi:hypothetical protein
MPARPAGATFHAALSILDGTLDHDHPAAVACRANHDGPAPTVPGSAAEA